MHYRLRWQFSIIFKGSHSFRFSMDSPEFICFKERSSAVPFFFGTPKIPVFKICNNTAFATMHTKILILSHSVKK